MNLAFYRFVLLIWNTVVIVLYFYISYYLVVIVGRCSIVWTDVATTQSRLLSPTDIYLIKLQILKSSFVYTVISEIVCIEPFNSYHKLLYNIIYKYFQTLEVRKKSNDMPVRLKSIKNKLLVVSNLIVSTYNYYACKIICWCAWSMFKPMFLGFEPIVHIRLASYTLITVMRVPHQEP